MIGTSVARIDLPAGIGKADISIRVHQAGDKKIELRIAPVAAETIAGHKGAVGTERLVVGERSVSLVNVPNIVSALLDRDGLALQDLGNGREVTFAISPHPSYSATEPSGGKIEDYLFARATASRFVLPLLLEPRTDLPLFPYQRKGVEWLCSKNRGILADDMGLGKTLQVIAAMRLLFFKGELSSALVVCPRSLVSNWEGEILKWAPDLCFVRMLPTPRIQDQAWRTVIGSAHILITTYEQMRNPPAVLVGQGVSLMVVDEAHRIRNDDSQTTSGIKAIKTGRLWALTGTPIERDAFDFATLLSILSPKSYSRADAKVSHSFVRSLARPFVLRRLKSEVLSELPPVMENRESLDLEPRQRQSYNAVMEKFSRSMDDQQVLAFITSLRQICDYDPISRQSAKANRITEILSNVRSVGEKAIVFSYLNEPLQMLKERLKRVFGMASLRMLTGDQSLAARKATIRDFKQLKKVTFLLASSRVGGEGLTLTEANHVIFFNEWWNPSSNNQARDRVVRLGQSRGVMVYTFICRSTIEELLLNILERKKATFEAVVNGLAEQKSSGPSLAALVAEVRQHLKYKS